MVTSNHDNLDTSRSTLGSDGMVTSNHDNLDTSGSTLGNGVRDSSSGRINHGHETNESESLQGEVDILGIKGVSVGILVSWEHVVAETKHSLSKSSKLHVGSLESVLPFLSEWQFTSVN